MNPKQFNEPFLKIAIRFTLIFFVIVVILDVIIGLFSSKGFTESLMQYSNYRYLTGKIAGAIIYGLIMAFYYKHKAKKLAEKQKK